LRRRKRVIIVKIPPMARSDLEKFLERLSKAIMSDVAIMRVTGDKIRIEVYGGETLAKRTMVRVRSLLREYSTPSPKRGGRVIRAGLINKEAGVAVPLDVLVEALRVLGWEARQVPEGVETRAPPDEVLALASSIAAALKEAALLHATRTAKKLVVAVAALTGESVPRAVARALAAGALEEDDEGRLHAAGDWREWVKRLAGPPRGEGV